MAVWDATFISSPGIQEVQGKLLITEHKVHVILSYVRRGKQLNNLEVERAYTHKFVLR